MVYLGSIVVVFVLLATLGRVFASRMKHGEYEIKGDYIKKDKTIKRE